MYAAIKTAPKRVMAKLTVPVTTPKAPPSTFPAMDFTALTRSSLTLEMNCCWSLGKRFLSCKESSTLLTYRSMVLAIPGTALTRAANCSAMSGTRKRIASATIPTRSRNERRIARPRGMSRESQRTGNDSASAKPPMTVVSTLGTRQTTNPSTTSTARIRTVRVRLEIRIGVASAVTSGSDFTPASAPDCQRPRTQSTSRFANFFPCQVPGVRSPRRAASTPRRAPSLFVLDPGYPEPSSGRSSRAVYTSSWPRYAWHPESNSAGYAGALRGEKDAATGGRLAQSAAEAEDTALVGGGIFVARALLKNYVRGCRRASPPG